LFEDFDGFIGEACKIDLVNYATHNPAAPRIHPNAEAYHFDIMTHFGDNEGVLFISFHADVLGHVLKAAEASGHEALLVLEQAPHLIEVTSAGARDNLQRTDYRLSDSEKARLLHQLKVPGTAWSAMDLHQPGLMTDYQQKLLMSSGAIFAIFVLASAIFIYFVYRAEQKRKAAEQIQDDFLSTVNHELRTPLTAIRGALGLLTHNKAGISSSQTDRLLQIALSNSNNLIELVNDLLDIRRLEYKDAKLDKLTANLVSIVQRSIDLNRAFAQQFGVTYHLTTAQNEILVDCNEPGIHQVMTNLLSNAAKYGAQNNQVQITLELSEKLVRVSVTDHGAGIPPHFRSRIFEKFAQADTGNQRGSKGTGLGLSIAKHIIDLHKGKIGFKSASGQGTTFYFELQLADPVASRHSA
jgi:signal transduction histidine kinase